MTQDKNKLAIHNPVTSIGASHIGQGPSALLGGQDKLAMLRVGIQMEGQEAPSAQDTALARLREECYRRALYSGTPIERALRRGSLGVDVTDNDPAIRGR